MNNLKSILKDNLIYYLNIRNISQKELAERLGISSAAVSNWTTGKNTPDIENLVSICKILNISINDLLGEVVSRYSFKEKRLISSYREHPEFQKAVDKLLNL